jgi:hypothetical protein
MGCHQLAHLVELGRLDPPPLQYTALGHHGHGVDLVTLTVHSKLAHSRMNPPANSAASRSLPFACELTCPNCRTEPGRFTAHTWHTELDGIPARESPISTGLDPVLDPELCQDALNVFLHCPPADTQNDTNRLGALALGQPVMHLNLARGQPEHTQVFPRPANLLLQQRRKPTAGTLCDPAKGQSPAPPLNHEWTLARQVIWTQPFPPLPREPARHRLGQIARGHPLVTAIRVHPIKGLVRHPLDRRILAQPDHTHIASADALFQSHATSPCRRPFRRVLEGLQNVSLKQRQHLPVTPACECIHGR